MKINPNLHSEENHDSLNEYGWTISQQYNFLKTIEGGELPNSSCLFNWANQNNPKINGLSAGQNFVQQPLYQKFKREEQELLSTTLPDSVIHKIKKAPYLVDYGCGDSSTTIQTLTNLLTSERLTLDQLAEKEYILYDSNPHALTAAQQNFTHFFITQGITPLPRIHAVLESWDDIIQPHHILDQFTGDKCIFSLGFTVGNLDKSNSTHFSNFSNNRNHTLLTTYFISPEEEEIPLLEATYGKFEKNKIPYIYHHDAELSQEAAIHQLTCMLRAGGRTDEYLNRITFTTQYDKDTGLLLIGFIPNEYLSFQIDIEGEKKERCFKKQFYPLYQSKRFPSNTNPLNHKQLYTKRGTHVGYDIYELPYNYSLKQSMLVGTTIGASILALILTFGQIQSNKQRTVKKQKEQAILALVDTSLALHNKEWENKQSDSFKIELFYSRCNALGNILNTLYNTFEFTGNGSFKDAVENFMINELSLIDDIHFWNIDRYAEEIQYRTIQLSIQFIKTHPLIHAQAGESPIIQALINHTDAIIHTANLTPEQAHHLQEICLGKKVTVLCKTPVLGHNTRSEYTVGIIKEKGTSLLVSVPTILLKTTKECTLESGSIVGPIYKPITDFYIGNDIDSFQIIPHIASGVNSFLQELSSPQ